jgi:hypothetical protein
MEKEKEIDCLVCNNKMGFRNCDISRHVKKHNITIDEYLKKFYKNNSVYEKCGFCDNDAFFRYKVDHIKKEYSLIYEKGFFCKTLECKRKISLDILGIEYDPKKFEKIGSKTEYLSKLYRIDLDDAKSKKYSPKADDKIFYNRLEDFQKIYGDEEGEVRYNKRLEGIIKNHAGNTFPCTLDNFINKYGIEKGTEVYNKRCERISYASSINFYIDKYGDVEGEKIWKNKFRQIRVSKSSSKINKLLDDLCLNYESEKNINGKFLDFYLNDYNIGIEFFGDYWHMNPKLYLPNEYNKRLKKTSSEIWETDDIRIDKIKEKCSSIIIIWESTNIDILLLEKTINDIKDKKIIIYL